MKKTLSNIIRVIKLNNLDKVLLILVALLSANSILAYIYEPKVNTVFDSIYYSTVLISTVGFGDITPTVFITKLFSIFVMIYGIVLFSIITSTIVSYVKLKTKLSNDHSIDEIKSKLKNASNLTKEELKQIESFANKHL